MPVYSFNVKIIAGKKTDFEVIVFPSHITKRIDFKETMKWTSNKQMAKTIKKILNDSLIDNVEIPETSNLKP